MNGDNNILHIRTQLIHADASLSFFHLCVNVGYAPITVTIPYSQLRTKYMICHTKIYHPMKLYT